MLFFIWSVLMILPIINAQKACSKDGKPCITRNFENVSVGNQAVRASNLISSHNVHRLGECMILCFGQNNCHGFNFREKPSSIYIVNCQLSNSSVRMNMTRMKNGPWVYYEDILVTQDVDECSNGTHNCSENANCINTPGSYNCQCLSGYKRNGENCSDIDECSNETHNCNGNANCTNTPGSYNCQCLHGYTWNGINCSDIDECSEESTNECHPNATCSNTPGSYDCQCKSGYTGNGILCIMGLDCASLYKSGERRDGIYTINPDGLGSFQVWCEMQTDGGGWTVFQRRQDASVDFYRGWQDYKDGFGDLNGNFWLGLQKINRLTKSGQNVLRVDLIDFTNDEAYAKYGTFSVASESELYKLNVGSFSGNAGDSLRYHNRMKFTTKDKDNDQWGEDNCASAWNLGAWWYNNCQNSNLNGQYLTADERPWTRINWYVWKNDHRSMKKTEMKIRSAPF